MDPGQLNKRVAIEAQDSPVPKNPAGEPQPTYSTASTVWAKITPATGSELYRGERLQASLTHTVVIRYYPGLTTLHRLNYGGRLLDINAVINVDELGVWHKLLCKELA
jgi:SPP1 family predicted phage head-tail adaptor